MSYCIKKISYDIAKEFSKTCELWQLNVDSDNNYYGIYCDNKLVSMCSYKQIGKNEARFKSNYTLKEYRKLGLMTALINYIYSNTNYKIYSAYCEWESLKIYLDLGFELINKRENKKFNCYIVRKEKINNGSSK